MECINYGTLEEGIILKRPSAKIKSPYVADVKVDNESILCHAPSLGCKGLCESPAIVYLSKIINPKACLYSITLVKCSGTYVCVNPKIAEYIVENCIKMNYLEPLMNIRKYFREKVILNSRFDFIGIDNNDMNFVLEVKSVPLVKDNYAYFPDGYRKRKGDTISPRALKHVYDLCEYKKSSVNNRSILCFVVQRSDCDYFKLNDDDKIYKEAVIEAISIGVEIIAVQIEWEGTGKGYFNKLLNIDIK
jgi:sugar fermentation stimulation protein A